MATDITVPALGESVTEATVGQWLKAKGEEVQADEPLVELETDKITLEVNAPAAGTIAEVLVQSGETVEVGALLGRIAEGAGSDVSESKAASDGSEAEAAPETAEAPPEKPAETGETKPRGEAEQPGDSSGDSGERVDVPVPSLGESVSEATLAQWLKQTGDSVAADEAIAELETDKITLEVNAPVAGTLVEQLVEEGDTVEVDALLGRIAKGDGGAAKAPPKQETPAAEGAPAKDGEAKEGATEKEAPAASRADAASSAEAKTPASALDPERAPRTGDRITRQDLVAFLSDSPDSMRPEDLSPAVRKLVRDRDIDPTRIPATGPGGRLTKEDVIAFVEGRSEAAPLPAPDTGADGRASEAPKRPAAMETRPETGERREERVKMTRLRQTIAKRLKEAQNTAAMLTTFNEVDMTAVNDIRARYRESFEKAHGTRLGMSCFFAKAVVQALREIPEVNARIEGEEIVYNHFYDIGMAVSTPNGLMVPVVRDVDRKSMAEIEATLRDLAKRGRDGKLSMDDLQGATFSITNGGVFGSLMSTPIINPPQSGILGMHKIQERPVAVDGEVQVRPMMYVALSYDHRLVDGREAVTFLVRVKECLEDPARLLLQM